MNSQKGITGQALRAKGFRLTEQRKLILGVLAGQRHLTAIEIQHKLNEMGSHCTEPTVYRTLHFLTQQGLVLVTHPGGRQLEYELASGEHHHFVCARCGGHFDLPDEAVRQAFGTLHDQSGFSVVEPHLTLHGLCPGCKNKE